MLTRNTKKAALRDGFGPVAPSQFEATFVGLAHTDEDIDAAIAAAAEALRAL
jgi:glutamate-1-semialdehyde aminotransferase